MARYDTTPESDAGGFFGTWGAFPYTAGGYIYASDFDGTLTVLRMASLATAADGGARVVPARRGVPQPVPHGRYGAVRPRRAGSGTCGTYDVIGREVAVLAAGEFIAGAHTLTWDGSALPPGAYFLRIEAGGTAQTLRLARVR